MKILNKRGVHNYQEKKLEKKLTEYFEKNPDSLEGFQPVNSFEELKALHDKYCIEEVEIISETKAEDTNTHQSFRDSMEPESPRPREDPMNRDEPIIRDYVKDDGFTKDHSEPEQASAYTEPTTFKDSFDIPDDSIEGDKKSSEPLNARPRQEKQSTPADPDRKIKNKSRKKFTKYAVDAVCALAGRGIVWYTTKDVTDERIQELILNDEISKASLDLVVYLDANTQGTVKEFFQLRIAHAQDLGTFTADEKEDLADALEDFLEYKKIEINPTINLGTIFLGMVFERALKAMQLKAETSSILEQLKNMRGESQYQAYQAPPEPDQATAPHPQENTLEPEQPKPDLE